MHYTGFQLQQYWSCSLQRQWFSDVLVRPTRAFALTLCSCLCADNSSVCFVIDRYLYNIQLNGTISTFIGQLTALEALSVTITIVSPRCLSILDYVLITAVYAF